MTMMNDAGELGNWAERIGSREEFAVFVRALTENLRAHPSEWENATLPEFLEALAAWVEDLPGYFHNRGLAVPEPPDWRTFALVLSAARIYE